MLPWTDRVRISDGHRTSRQETAHQVGNETIGCPVPSADDVTGAGGSNCNLVLLKATCWEVGIAESGCDQLRAGLAVATGIESAEPILLR